MGELVLVVEDEPALRSTVEYNLVRRGFRTVGAACGREACEIAVTHRPSALLLDLNLPDISGFEVCRTLRSNPCTRDIPVMIVSARDDEIDRVVAFEIGADDYVSKPFSVRELLLRVEGLLRRSSTQVAKTALGGAKLSIGPVRLDVGRRHCSVGDAEVRLSSTEFELLRTLMERPGRVQSRSQLLMQIWPAPDQVSDRSIDTHMRRLRRKLGPAGELILTVRGVGYAIDPHVA